MPGVSAFGLLQLHRPLLSAVTVPVTPSGNMEMVTSAPGSVSPVIVGVAGATPLLSVNEDTVMATAPVLVNPDSVGVGVKTKLANDPWPHRHENWSLQSGFRHTFCPNAVTQESPPGQSEAAAHALLHEARIYDVGVGVGVFVGRGVGVSAGI